MRESGRSLLGRALGWWPVAVDLGLALVVFALTADQGTGTQDFELFGEAPAATRVPLAVGMAMLVLIRRVNPYPLLVLGLGAWALMGAPLGPDGRRLHDRGAAPSPPLVLAAGGRARPRRPHPDAGGLGDERPVRGRGHGPGRRGAGPARPVGRGPPGAGRAPARRGRAAGAGAAPGGGAGQGPGAGPDRPGDARRGRPPGRADGPARRGAGGVAGRPPRRRAGRPGAPDRQGGARRAPPGPRSTARARGRRAARPAADPGRPGPAGPAVAGRRDGGDGGGRGGSGGACRPRSKGPPTGWCRRR